MARTASLRSYRSFASSNGSTTQVDKDKDKAKAKQQTQTEPTTNTTTTSSTEPQASSSSTGGPQNPPEFTYAGKAKTPKPDYKTPEKSKIGKFLSKFKSPAVKRTTQLRDRAKEEQERTGVVKLRSTPAPPDAVSWAVAA